MPDEPPLRAAPCRPSPPPGEPRTVTAPDGVRLAVREWGTGHDPAAVPTILLVHGYPDTHRVWCPVAARLADRFRVAAYDVRGAGASQAPRRRAGYALPRLRDDLLAVADAVSPERPVHVAGHDWGSVQAWEAVTEPAAAPRIAAFTSVSGPCLDHVGHWVRSRVRRPAPRRLGQLARQGLHSWYVGFFRLPVLPELAWSPVSRAWPRYLASAEGVPPDRVRTGGAALRRDALHGLGLYRANAARLARPRQRRTDRPVQVVVPARDRFVTPALAAADLPYWAPDLTLRRLDAGHWAPLTHPDALAAALAAFTTTTARGTG